MMRAQITLCLLLSAVFEIKVRCVQDITACPRKETPAGVLVLTPGKEVMMSCRGEVTVDGQILAKATKNEILRTKRSETDFWGSQKESENTVTGTFHSEIRNDAVPDSYQNVTATGIYSKTKEKVVTTAHPPKITTGEQIRSEHVVHTVNQPTLPNRAGGEAKEGGASSVTMKMGTSPKMSTSVEYEDYEDYEDNEVGLRVTRAIKKRARWIRNGQFLRGRVEKGGVLRIPSLQFSDSGNYSCYRGEKLISSLKINVAVPPERPSLSCYKKFHTSKVRCEWISNQPIIPPPQCYMLLKKGMEVFSHVPCSYTVKKSRCWCVLPSEVMDRNIYIAKLCVNNIAGNATSIPFHFFQHTIIKPDPPARVQVKEAEGQLHTLTVSWSYPATWRHGYYFLIFRLRYRPLQSKEYQLVASCGTDLSWSITDAIPHTLYEVQVQAKDEYDGLWSEWSSPVNAHTWTGPETTPAPDSYSSLEPFWTFPEGSGEMEDDFGMEVKAADGKGTVWMYVLWTFGLCVLFTLTVLSVYSLRHRVLFKTKREKTSCSPPCVHSSPPPVLHQPLMDPQQQSQHHFLPVQGEDEQGIHLHNVNYFLLHRFQD